MPTDADLFRAWCSHRGDPHALIAQFELTPEAFLDFTERYAQRLAAWRALLRDHAADAALAHQTAAAEALRTSLAGDNPVEVRRAASALARLASAMARDARRTPTQPPAPPAADETPPPEPPAPDDADNPLRALAGALSRLVCGRLFSPSVAAAHLAVQLAPDAVLDDAPIPPEVRADPDRLAKLLAGTPLPRIAGCGRRRQWRSDPGPGEVLLTFEYASESTPAFLLTARLTRPHELAPWLIARLSFPKEPPSS